MSAAICDIHAGYEQNQPGRSIEQPESQRLATSGYRGSIQGDTRPELRMRGGVRGGDALANCRELRLRRFQRRSISEPPEDAYG
jgi:hypothetical protein